VLSFVTLLWQNVLVYPRSRWPNKPMDCDVQFWNEFFRGQTSKPISKYTLSYWMDINNNGQGDWNRSGNEKLRGIVTARRKIIH